MYWYRRVLMIVGAVTVTLFGCREIHYHGYEFLELDLYNGVLAINTIGFHGQGYEVEGKKMADYGFPYHIQFTYISTSSDELSKMVIKDIKLFGENTSTLHTLKSIQSETVKVFGEKKQIRVSLGPLTKKEYEYQNYTMKATVVIYKTETEFYKEKIEVLLKTEYRKERRSDWFDKKMSV